MQHRPAHRTLATLFAFVLILSAPACGGDDEGDDGASAPPSEAAAPDDTTSTTGAAGPVQAQLLPMEGPVQAGTWASPALGTLATIELGDDWTVLAHADGVLALGHEVDPATGPRGVITIGSVTGVFDSPFLTQEEAFGSLPAQLTHVRPLPEDGLHGHLASLPGFSVSEPEAVQIAGTEGERFTVTTGDLPPEADGKCGADPCMLAFDAPGMFATVWLPDSTTEVTTFEVDGMLMNTQVEVLGGETPAGFEDAAAEAVESLRLGEPVEIDEKTLIRTFMEAFADDAARWTMPGLTAPGSPAAEHAELCYLDGAARASQGQAPYSDELVETGEGTYEVGGLTWSDFEIEDGLISSYTLGGVPVGDRSEDLSDLAPIVAGPVTLEPRVLYRSMISQNVLVTFDVTAGAEQADVSGVTVTSTDAGGAEVASLVDLSGIVLPPHWSAPAAFQLAPQTSLPGAMRFRGTINGQPIDATLELPAHEG